MRDDVLPALEVGVQEAADQLGVTRQALSAIIHGHAAITPEMALRLELWLGAERGGRADLWLTQQARFDLWQARETIKRHAFKRKVRALNRPLLLAVAMPEAKRKAAARPMAKKKVAA